MCNMSMRETYGILIGHSCLFMDTLNKFAQLRIVIFRASRDPPTDTRCTWV